MRAERGFTLLELMTAVGVAGIFVAMMGAGVLYTQTSLYEQLDSSDAQQNARASISLLKRYLRQAGWGMQPNTEMGGAPFIGSCHVNGAGGTAGVTARQSFTCDNVDLDGAGILGSDRMRILYVTPVDRGFEADGDPYTAGAGSIPALDDDVYAAVVGDHPYPAGTIAVISGTCQAGGGLAADVVTVTGNAPGVDTVLNYTYTALESGGFGLACAGGYQKGYWFGKGDVADFFIDRSVAAHPALKLRLDPNRARTAAMTVAFDIDDFQVRYHLDTGNPGTKADPQEPDRIADVVCDDLTAPACAGAYAVREKAARIVGIDVAVVARTRRFRLEWKKAATSNITVHNHTTVGRDDGYRRWIYRTTVTSRNNKVW